MILYLTWNSLADVVDEMPMRKLLLKLAADVQTTIMFLIRSSTLFLVLHSTGDLTSKPQSDIPSLTFLNES